MLGYIFFLLSFSLVTHTAYAQQLLGDSSAVSIVPNRSSILPYEDIVFTLNDYSINTIGADIRWYVDGIEKVPMRNERSITVRSGALGVEQKVSAHIIRKNAPPVITDYTMRPILITIVVESNTYTPNFYKGRSLPSANAPVRAIAIVHDGKGSTLSSLSYKWKLNGKVLSGGTLKGKHTIEFPAPQFGDSTLSLEVYNSAGKRLGAENTSLVLTSPSVQLYEHSALRGLTHIALTERPIRIEKGAIVYAEPYFLDVTDFGNSTVYFSWKHNNELLPIRPQAVNIIDTREGINNGDTLLLTIQPKYNTSQYIKERFKIQYK